MRVAVDGIGVIAPGLPDWPAGRRVLAGAAPYVPAPPVVPASPLLPANERRRMVATVRLALAVGGEALAQAACDAADLAAVFASSGGDGATIHEILAGLAGPEREVSPTRFHNSVHNAPAGYWSIATRSRAPTTSLGAHDSSFAAGLLEAAAQVAAGSRPVILVAYDLPYPEPLAAKRPIASLFGVALVLAPAASRRSLADLTLRLDPAAGPAAGMADPALEALRRGNPAARALPLLALLARGAGAPVVLDHVAGNRLVVTAAPPC